MRIPNLVPVSFPPCDAHEKFAAALKIDPSNADAKANLQQALRMLKEERREA